MAGQLSSTAVDPHTIPTERLQSYMQKLGFIRLWLHYSTVVLLLFSDTEGVEGAGQRGAPECIPGCGIPHLKYGFPYYFNPTRQLP